MWFVSFTMLQYQELWSFAVSMVLGQHGRVSEGRDEPGKLQTPQIKRSAFLRMGCLLQGRSQVGIPCLAQPVLPITKLTKSRLCTSLFPQCGITWGHHPRAAHPSSSPRRMTHLGQAPASPHQPQAEPRVALSRCPVQNVQQLLTRCLAYSRLCLLGPCATHQGRRNRRTWFPINSCNIAGSLKNMEPRRDNSQKVCLLSDLMLLCFYTQHSQKRPCWPPSHSPGVLLMHPW